MHHRQGTWIKNFIHSLQYYTLMRTHSYPPLSQCKKGSFQLVCRRLLGCPLGSLLCHSSSMKFYSYCAVFLWCVSFFLHWDRGYAFVLQPGILFHIHLSLETDHPPILKYACYGWWRLQIFSQGDINLKEKKYVRIVSLTFKLIYHNYWQWLLPHGSFPPGSGHSWCFHLSLFWYFLLSFQCMLTIPIHLQVVFPWHPQLNPSLINSSQSHSPSFSSQVQTISGYNTPQSTLFTTKSIAVNGVCLGTIFFCQIF